MPRNCIVEQVLTAYLFNFLHVLSVLPCLAPRIIHECHGAEHASTAYMAVFSNCLDGICAGLRLFCDMASEGIFQVLVFACLCCTMQRNSLWL